VTRETFRISNCWFTIATHGSLLHFLHLFLTFHFAEVDPSIDNLYTANQSLARDDGRRLRFGPDGLSQAEEERTLSEQQAILQLDDIVEDVSDEDDEDNPWVAPAVAQLPKRVTRTAVHFHQPELRFPPSKASFLDGPDRVQQPEIIVIDDSD
jgi:hypothetical protein